LSSRSVWLQAEVEKVPCELFELRNVLQKIGRGRRPRTFGDDGVRQNPFVC
jgi:hypothetical protein